MTIRIVKNNTPSPIVLNDLGGIIIPASGQVDLSPGKSLEQLSNSESLAIALGDGSLTLNIGDDDIPFPRSLDIIRNIGQHFAATKPEGKLIVSSTPRIGKTLFYVTSRDDNADGSCSIGKGSFIHVNHKVFEYGDTENEFASVGIYVDEDPGDSCSGYEDHFHQFWKNTSYMDFEVRGNKTYVYDGGVSWVQSKEISAEKEIMSISIDIVNRVSNMTPYVVTPGTGNTSIMGGYLVVPHPAGQGDYNLPLGQTQEQTSQNNICMMEYKPSTYNGEYDLPYFWSVEYDLTTGKYFNLLPVMNPYDPYPNTNTGDPNTIRMVGNIFTQEIKVMTLIQDLLLVGDSNGFFPIQCSDPAELGQNMRLKITGKTIVNIDFLNHGWTLTGFWKMYRESTTT